MGPKNSTLPYKEEASSSSTKVRINDSAFDNVTLDCSDFNDVRFVHCNLTNVRFENTDLSHVLFVGVDLKNVNFQDCGDVLTGIYWGHMRISDASFSRDTFNHNRVYGRWGLENARPICKILLPKAEDSPGAVFERKPQLGNVTFHCATGTSNSMVPERYYQDRVELDDRRSSLFEDFLERAAEGEGRAIECLMQRLFPAGTIYVHEYEPRDKRLKSTLQVKYSASSLSGRQLIVGDTTYFGSRRKRYLDTPLVESARLPRNISFATSLLLGSRSCRVLARPWLYKRSFVFQCSAAGAKEFLAAHEETYEMVEGMQLRHPVTDITLYYTFNGANGCVRTRDTDWRSLMRYIRHDYWTLVDLRVYISPQFWELADWRDGKDAVYEQVGLSLQPREGKAGNMLFHLAKVAGYTLRVLSRVEGSQYRGTRLHLEIVGAKDREKKKFVEGLQGCLQKKMRSRPILINGLGYH